MSDEPGDPKPAKGKYRSPPREHQFKKGQSGNPRGRPPKREPAATPRHLRHKLIDLAFSPVRARTENGEEDVPLLDALLKRCATKALTGHGPSTRYLLNSFKVAFDEHNAVHEKMFDHLEQFEQHLTLNPEAATAWSHTHVNKMRKLTRRS